MMKKMKEKMDKGKGCCEKRSSQKPSLYDRELKRLEWSVKEKGLKGPKGVRGGLSLSP